MLQCRGWASVWAESFCFLFERNGLAQLVSCVYDQCMTRCSLHYSEKNQINDLLGFENVSCVACFFVLYHCMYHEIMCAVRRWGRKPAGVVTGTWAWPISPFSGPPWSALLYRGALDCCFLRIFLFSSYGMIGSSIPPRASAGHITSNVWRWIRRTKH